MPIALIEEESDIFRHYDAAMVESANTIDIAFQDELGDQPEHEATVRRFLAGEFVRQGHERLRQQGVAEDLIPDEADLPRSLELDVFPDEDREALEQKLRDFVAQAIRDPEGTGDGRAGPPPQPAPPIKPAVSGSHQVGHMCAQVSSGIPGRKLGALPERPVFPPGKNFFLITFLMSVQVGNLLIASDAVRCRVDDAPFPLRPDQMLVNLVKANLTTMTQITAWNRTRGAIASLHDDGGVALSGSAPAEMLLGRHCGGADSLVFSRYAGLLNWVTLGHMDPGTFWDHFGGRRLSFTWIF